MSIGELHSQRLVNHTALSYKIERNFTLLRFKRVYFIAQTTL